MTKDPGDRISVDLLLLKKKINRIGNPGQQAILISLLDYISNSGSDDRTLTKIDKTSKPERDKTQHNKQELNNSKSVLRPSRFQLLQSKFMNPNHEPSMKKPKEVGKLTFKENNYTSQVSKGSIVKKLDLSRLKITRDEKSEKELHFHSGKNPLNKGNGKDRVKAILNNFTVAEEKAKKMPENIENNTPKIFKRNTVIAALKEKFEENCTICSVKGATSSLVPKEQIVKISASTKCLREARALVLHTTTMTTTCIEHAKPERAALKEHIVPCATATSRTVKVYSPKTLIPNSKMDSQIDLINEDKQSTNRCVEQYSNTSLEKDNTQMATDMKENVQKSKNLEDQMIQGDGIHSLYKNDEVQLENMNDNSSAVTNTLYNGESESAHDMQFQDESGQHSKPLERSTEASTDSLHNIKTNGISSAEGASSTLDNKPNIANETMKHVSGYLSDNIEKVESNNIIEQVLSDSISNNNTKDVVLNIDKYNLHINDSDPYTVNNETESSNQEAEHEHNNIPIYMSTNAIEQENKSKQQNNYTDEEHTTSDNRDSMPRCVKSEHPEMKDICKMENEVKEIVNGGGQIGDGNILTNIIVHKVETTNPPHICLSQDGLINRGEVRNVPYCPIIKELSSGQKATNKHVTKFGNICQLYVPEQGLQGFAPVVTDTATCSTQPNVPSQMALITIVKVHQNTWNGKEAKYTGNNLPRCDETHKEQYIERVKDIPQAKNPNSLFHGIKCLQETRANKESDGSHNEKYSVDRKLDSQNQSPLGRDLSGTQDSVVCASQSKINDSLGNHSKQGNHLMDMSMNVMNCDHRDMEDSTKPSSTDCVKIHHEDSKHLLNDEKTKSLDLLSSMQSVYSLKEENQKMDNHVTSKAKMQDPTSLSESRSKHNMDNQVTSKANLLDPVSSSESISSQKQGSHKMDKQVTSKYQIPSIKAISSEHTSLLNKTDNTTVNDMSKYKVQSYKETENPRKQSFKPLIVTTFDTFKHDS